jgi:hypothetical protein
MSEETLDMLAELRALVSERSDLVVRLDSETMMHCPVCHDTGKVTPDQTKAWEERIHTMNKGDNA